MTSAAATLDDQHREPAPADGRRRHIGRWVGVVTVVALVAGAIVLWASPLLGLRTIEVTGVHDPQVVAEVQAAVQVADGTPLARIDLDAVAERVRAVGPVAEVSVTRQWPHTVVVAARLRQPVATTQANGSWWLLDAAGNPFRELADRPDGLLPVELATPGPRDRATLAALDICRSLDPRIRDQVASIVAASDYDIRLRLTDGRTVIWGSATDAAVKNRILPAVLRQPGSVFDISDPTLVTVSGQ